MPKIAPARTAQILGHLQVQSHHLIAQAGVFYRSMVSGLDDEFVGTTVLTAGPFTGLCPDFNPLVIVGSFDFQLTYA